MRRTPAPRSLHTNLTSPLLQLQRTLGNQRITQLIKAKRLTPEGKIPILQPKLTIGAADDQYEQEADRVARQVMSMPDMQAAAPPAIPEEEDKEKTLQTKRTADTFMSAAPSSLAASITPYVQRRTENIGEENGEMPVQAKPDNGGLQRQPVLEEDETGPIQAAPATQLNDSFEAGEHIESRLDRSKGSGNILPDSVRTFMEPRFGMDFGHVRVHTGSEAIQMNRDVGAKAFTHGPDIYYGAGQSPGDLELTAHELTHVVQQTGATPLQPKRLDESTTYHSGVSIQRACSACKAGRKEEEHNQAPIQRVPVRERTADPQIQGAWTLKETVSNSSPIIGESTRGNGSTLALPLPTGVYGKAKSWQVAGFWKIYGGNAHLVMRRDTRYTFVHTGADNNLLTLRGGASIFGGAEADDLHYGQAGAAVAGNIAVRTIADPAPKQKSFFPPIHDGGRSEAEESAIGEVDVSLPVGDATVDVNIPLTKTDEGELATLSESMPIHHDVAGGGEWKTVDVYLVAYVELAADSENEFLGTDGDVNWAHATAQYNLGWEERIVPAPPDEEGEEAEILVKRRCWSARNCEGKAYSQKFSHCHNCRNYASGKSLGEPGNCENC